MAWRWVILFGLLGGGLATAEVNENGNRTGMPGANGLGGSDDDFYKHLATEILDAIKSRRDEPLVGQNEFHLALARNRRFQKGFPPAPFSQKRLQRFKRSFIAIPCNNRGEEKMIAGKNDFESGTTPRKWIRNPWDNNLEESEEDRAENGVQDGLPATCIDDRFRQVYEIFQRNATEKRIRKRMKNKGKGKDKNKKDNDVEREKRSEDLKEVYPDNFIKAYSSKRQTGCGCSLNARNIGCACCLYFEQWDIIICAGCGYVFQDLAFVVKIQVEDFTIFSWQKSFAKSAFSKYLELFSKSLCLPHQFSAIINACLELSINFSPSFNKSQPSILAACPSIVAQVFFFWDQSLLELPCWELEFDLPFLRIGGGPRVAKLTYENKQLKPAKLAKKLYVTEDIEEVTKLVGTLGKMRRNSSRFVKREAGTRMIQNTGESPRPLKRGNPTVPINWKPTKTNALRYMVVLYTQPLAAPLTSEDLKDEAVPDAFRSMALDGMDRRLPDFDPSIINLKVHATMARSCGGVIVAKDKVLTLCACIKFFYLYHKYKRKPQPRDNLDIFNLVAKDIYVTHADRSFTANQVIYELVQNPDFFMKKSKCFDAIERSIKKNINEASFTDTHMYSVVMTITMDFDGFDKLKLVPWLDMSNARTKPVPAEMSVIGMRKTKAMDIFDGEGWEFDPLYEAVQVPFVSCPRTQFCRHLTSSGKSLATVSKEFTDHTECFCAKDPGFQLCDGVVGFPVITSQGLVGLNAIPMDCKGVEGSMVAAMFSEATIEEIDKHLNEEDDTNDSTPSSTTVPRNPEPSTGPVITASFSTTIVYLSIFILIW